MEVIGPALLVGAIVFGVVLAVLWLVLPFAMFGTKPLLRQIVANQHETHKLLRQLLHDLQKNSARY